MESVLVALDLLRRRCGAVCVVYIWGGSQGAEGVRVSARALFCARCFIRARVLLLRLTTCSIFYRFATCFVRVFLFARFKAYVRF